MKIAGALALVVATLTVSACASGHGAAVATTPSGSAGCHANRTCPALHGSYAWRPARSPVSLVCGVSDKYHQFVDYRGHFYLCELPIPGDPHAHDGVDFNGPTTVAAGPVPLKPDQLRFTVFVSTRRPAELRVFWGDGTHWQRRVTRNRTFNLVHAYPRRSTSYFLVTLRGKAGYLGVSGVGPFRGPPPGPRTRYCAYIQEGKGGVLSASESLPCSTAKKLFATDTRGKVRGYRCHEAGLPPAWSDAAIETCIDGPRAFVFTTNS